MFLNSFTYMSSARNFGNEFQHPDLIAMHETYMRIRDCLTDNVKARGKVYLPDPSEVREDPAIAASRYDKYHKRAVFVPVTRRTQQGLVGQVFVRKPVLNVGNLPEDVAKRISVSGQDVSAFANYALREVVAMGRGCIFVGSGDNGLPMVDFAETENIIAWAELPYGKSDDLGRNIQMALLRTYTTTLKEDGLKVEQVARLAHYRLDDRGYAYVRFLQSDWSNGAWTNYAAVVVRGTHLRHLPVYPVGADTNTFRVDAPPLSELSALNVSHYVNSADYEEHVNVAGQVTAVISGLSQQWYDKNINAKMAFGVRAPMPLPKEAKAYLLQANANSTAKEALATKEAMMVSVGARLIEQRQVRRTATESNIEAESYHSILGHMAINVATAISAALVEAGAYFEGDNSKNSLALNTEFGIIASSAEHRRLVLEEWQKGTRSFKEMRRALRQYDDTLDDDAVAQKDIESGIEFMTKVASVGSKPVAGSDNRTNPQQGNTNDA